MILGANGKERNTTVSDARKLGLLPSVTSVIGIKNKPELETWKQEQVIRACIKFKKEEDESDEQYAKRIMLEAKKTTTDAATHGSLMHEQMEHILLGRPHSKDESLAPYIRTFKEWADANIEKTYWCEKALVGAGYAGRCDAYVRMRGIGDAIIDLKNRKVNPKYDPFYDTDCAQLWAYRIASENPQAACVSVVLASNDPESIKHDTQGQCYQRRLLCRRLGIQLPQIECQSDCYTPPDTQQQCCWRRWCWLGVIGSQVQCW